MAYSPTRLASCPSRWLSLVCKRLTPLVTRHCALSLPNTGMQWKCLPVPKDTNGNPAIHYTTVYKSLPDGPMMGRCGRRSWPAWPISPPRSNSTSVCSMVTGPTPSPKKGGWSWVFGVQTPEGRESHRDNGQPWLCLSSPSCCSRERNGYGAVSRGAESVEASGQKGRSEPERRLYQPRWRL